MTLKTEHYFVFSRFFRDHDRLCGECGLSYNSGTHLAIDKLQPYTSYACPSGDAGHLSRYTGAYPYAMRGRHDHICSCGAELVEEDGEVWRLSFEMRVDGGPWHPVERISTRHSTHSQRDGLLGLIEQGEPVRNVKLIRLDAEASS